MLALRSLKVPYFVFPHGMLDPWFKAYYPLKHLKKLVYWHLAEKHVLARAKAVVFTNGEEARLARLSFHHAVWNERTVRFGIEPVPQNGAALRQHFRAGFPELAGKRVLLFLGRLHEKKGCDILVRAFASICHLDPRLHLVLAGPANTQVHRDLNGIIEEAALQQRVTRVDFISGERKWGAIYSAELFCLSSHQENFGIAVVEALACGTPVLISNKVNIHEEIARAGAGIVDVDTVEGTVASLRRWIDFPEGKLLQMKQAARECFERHFHVAYAVDDLLNIVTGPADPRGDQVTGPTHSALAG